LSEADEFGEIMKHKLSAWSGSYLAASKRCLKQGIAQRKSMETTLKNRVENYEALLEESLALQKHLRQLTHHILSAQEAERKKLSRELQDEIAQTLLGINVRLLALKTAAKDNKEDLKNEIAITQGLVQESIQLINQFTSELNTH
jgi:signal transduction histidine kinase